MLLNMSGTAEEYCYSNQVTFRIATVFFVQGSSQEWPRKATSTDLSKTTLYPCFVHLGPYLIFTMSSEEERRNEENIFIGTSLWNVTVLENYLRLRVKMYLDFT